MNNALKKEIKNLPDNPGCYRFYDQNKKLLYVGKAESLKKRVRQYFANDIRDSRIRRMVARIHSLEIIKTQSDHEALILEQNLIKSQKPIFNIVLTDSKKYPYIQLKNFKHPRFQIVRSVNPKNGIYFGPIAHGYKAFELLQILNFLYPFRKCKRLPKKKCIYLDLKQCLGPCINLVTKEDYEPIFKEVKRIFSGDIDFLVDKLKKNLEKAIQDENYLLAKKWKEYLDLLKTFLIKPSEFKSLNSYHVIARQTKDEFVCYLVSFYLGGKWMGIQHFFMEKSENKKDEFEKFIVHLYHDYPKPDHILISDDIDLSLLAKHMKVTITNPKQGFKKNIILKNALDNANEVIKRDLSKWKRQRTNRLKGHKIIENIIGKEIYSIYMVDSSHIQTKNYVAAFVCYLDGLPNKNYYRYINLTKQLITGDTDAIYQAVKKFFNNYENNNSIFCDLLIIDGGINQINAANKALEELKLVIPIVGLSKDEHHKTARLVLDCEESIDLEPGPLLQYLSSIQDEAHRFVNTYFQQKREQELLIKSYDLIKNIGSRTWEKLLKRYQSFVNITNAPLDELIDFLGQVKGTRVFNYFNNGGDKN